jgi:rhodanese-related sulfurtransferase
MPRTKGILIEAALVLATGSVLAMAANHFSPRGLRLGQNYFPGSEVTSSTLPDKSTNGAGAGSPEPADDVTARLKQKGLNIADRQKVLELIQDPGFAQNSSIIIDARDPEHYAAGHIPGAYEFDHYHPEKYAPALAPLFETAQKIIVYCNGGDCEDSEFTALMLRETFSVPSTRLFVYPGGIKDWEEHKQPIEMGARNSGQTKASR